MEERHPRDNEGEKADNGEKEELQIRDTLDLQVVKILVYYCIRRQGKRWSPFFVTLFTERYQGLLVCLQYHVRDVLGTRLMVRCLCASRSGECAFYLCATLCSDAALERLQNWDQAYTARWCEHIVFWLQAF